jgi:hypothetical protein
VRRCAQRSPATPPRRPARCWPGPRCRWRIENLFKYLEGNYGLHRLCDYHAEITSDARLIASPERTAGRAGGRARPSGSRLAFASAAAGRLAAGRGAAWQTAVPLRRNTSSSARDNGSYQITQTKISKLAITAHAPGSMACRTASNHRSAAAHVIRCIES